MKAIPNNPRGFTLIEMLVTMAVGLIVMIAIYSAFANHQRSHVTQQLVVDMQQNARAAMSLMKREIRMMGYDPTFTDGVDNDADGKIDQDDDVGPPETSGASIIDAKYDNSNGLSFLRFSADLNYNSSIDGDEDITYILVGTQLQRNGQILAYDIETVGFAYAFDDDDDGELDQTGGANIIWAIDSDGDGQLDKELDTNDDGVIDENDTEGGANMGNINIADIRGVRIWLLTRTRQPIKGQADNRTYVVGANHRGPADGDWDPRRKRMLLTTTIFCHNMGI